MTDLVATLELVYQLGRCSTSPEPVTAQGAEERYAELLREARSLPSRLDLEPLKRAMVPFNGPSSKLRPDDLDALFKACRALLSSPLTGWRTDLSTMPEREEVYLSLDYSGSRIVVKGVAKKVHGGWIWSNGQGRVGWVQAWQPIPASPEPFILPVPTEEGETAGGAA